MRLTFHKARPLIIGVIHLPALPGSPNFKLTENFMSELIDFTIRNSKRLEEGGVDGIILENYHDYPFSKRVNDVKTISAIAIITHEVVKEVSIPVGINLLRNSCPEAAVIALTAGASFIRCNAFCEVIVCPEGIIEPCAREVYEVFRYFDRKVQVLADILVKHASPLHSMSIEDLIRDYEERCLADAIIVTGERTGKAPNPKVVAQILKVSRLPVLVGSGITPENVHLYKSVSGYIVGTYLKNNKGEIELEKVKKLVNIIKK